MTDATLIDADITALAKLIERREVSPVAVTRAYLDRIEAQDATLGAYISVYPEQAIDAARQAEAEIAGGVWRGPLHGVPLAIKDLIQVAGTKRTCGSKLIDEAVATEDSTSVQRLRGAGAIILGLANLHEFAFGPTGINRNFALARNPWNTDRVCGGSSSGSGCAVAGGLAAGALGTDTGGSIRIPATLCGIVGLKQTFGLASSYGIYPVSTALDHGGPMTRSVSDAALMLSAIAGPDPLDTNTAAARTDDYAADLDAGVAGLKIGVPRAFFYDGLHADTRAAVEAALVRLGDLGADVIEVTPPVDCDEVYRAWDAIALYDALAVHGDHMMEAPEKLLPDVRARLELGRDYSSDDRERASAVQQTAMAAMDQFMGDFAALAVPTAIMPAAPIDDPSLEIDGEPVSGVGVYARLTRFAAFTGQPAISVPCGFSADGMPIGLQLIGARFGERRLLQVASAYEQATEWHNRRPPAWPVT
jgi:aspartyl-tRNA(Asn)/glutamyl-tRNA(Gln) amidotransferase subunit A